MEPTDFDIQRQRISDRLRRAQEFQTAQVPQGQMVSGHYVAPSATQYLATALKQFAGFSGEKKANQELEALTQKRQELQGSEMRALTEALRGTPENAPIPGQPGPVLPAQPGNISDFYARAAQSPLAELRTLGMQGGIKLAETQAQKAQQDADRQRLMGILQSSTPQQAIAAGVPPETVKQYYESRNYGRDKVQFKDIGGQLMPVTEYGETPQGVAPISKTGNPFADLVVRDASGQIVPNAPLVQTKQGIARAGAAKTNVSVNMPDKKFYEGLGTAVSGQIEKGFEQAKSAVETLNNANQIASGLEKAFVGPLANQRVTLAQIGQVLGVSGKDATESLVNTRNVIQGLARQELAAAGQMKGQGQITENERAILKKAEAGEISAMTKPELQTFIGAIRKTARARVAAHQRNIQQLGSDPQAATILPYLQIDAPQDFGAPAAQPSGMPPGFEVIR